MKKMVSRGAGSQAEPDHAPRGGKHSAGKQKLKGLFISALALGSLALPFLASAQNAVQEGLSTNGLQGLFGSGGLNADTSLPQLIAEVIQLMLLFAGGVAIIFVVIGGYQYITSGGNEESAEKGRKTLTNAIIGVIIIILSYTIITVIANLVASPSGQGF